MYVGAIAITSSCEHTSPRATPARMSTSRGDALSLSRRALLRSRAARAEGSGSFGSIATEDADARTCDLTSCDAKCEMRS